MADNSPTVFTGTPIIFPDLGERKPSTSSRDDQSQRANNLPQHIQFAGLSPASIDSQGSQSTVMSLGEFPKLHTGDIPVLHQNQIRTQQIAEQLRNNAPQMYSTWSNTAGQPRQPIFMSTGEGGQNNVQFGANSSRLKLNAQQFFVPSGPLPLYQNVQPLSDTQTSRQLHVPTSGDCPDGSVRTLSPLVSQSSALVSQSSALVSQSNVQHTVFMNADLASINNPHQIMTALLSQNFPSHPVPSTIPPAINTQPEATDMDLSTDFPRIPNLTTPVEIPDLAQLSVTSLSTPVSHGSRSPSPQPPHLLTDKPSDEAMEYAQIFPPTLWRQISPDVVPVVSMSNVAANREIIYETAPVTIRQPSFEFCSVPPGPGMNFRQEHKTP
eukprot:611405_1